MVLFWRGASLVFCGNQLTIPAQKIIISAPIIHAHMPYKNAGKMYTKAIGSRAEVMHNTAHHTSGGLEKKHLALNKHGRIVSKKASALAKKVGLKRLAKAGYAPFAKGSTAIRRIPKRR